MARNLTLQITRSRSDLGYRAVYAAVAATSPMVTDVFVIRKPPAAPGVPPLDYFEGVASPTELEQLPAGTPLPGGTQYRAATYSMTYGTVAERETDITLVERSITNLIAALNGLDQTADNSVETVVLS